MPVDAVKVAPHVYRVVFENERVRVLESRMSPGAKSEMHSHPPPVVGIGLTAGKYRFTSPDGQTMEAEMPAGHALYFDAVEHSTENIGNTDSAAILVELK